MGRTLAEKYRLDALIGIGGMGAVYNTHHLALDRCVALKILQPNIVLGDKRMVALFEREAKTAAQLAHENIAAILDAGRTSDNLAYIAMEWLEGRTLEDEMMEQGALSFERVSEVLRQVSSALDAAHDANIVHRDLKPSNIMLIRRSDGREQVKVLDFGIAKVISENTNSPVSAVMGTLHYASPEQLNLGSRIDGRADIYSLGVVVYEMLTGELPFKATSIHELARQHLTETPPPLRRLRPDAPAALENLIFRLLAKDPKDRPRRAGEIPRLFEQAFGNEATQSASADYAATDHAASYPFKSQLAGDASELFSDLSVFERPAGPAPQRPAEGKPVSLGYQRFSRRLYALLGGLVLVGAVLLAVVLYRSFWADQPIDSVAVLPFKNVSADPNVEYLGAGITESLITSLSRLPKLKVIARSSVFRYKDRENDPKTVGRELNIEAVVAGQVVQRGDGLTISVELVSTQDGRLIWSEQYQRKLADLLKVQEDITREISVKLRSQLTGEQQQMVMKKYTDDPELYRLYLNGRFNWNQRTPEAIKKGITYFQELIAKDPSNALAFAGLADSYFALGPAGINALSSRETMPKQREYSIKALELDGQLAESHTALAVVKLVYDWDWAGAELSYRRALELNPNYAVAHNWYAAFLTARGRSDEAIASVQRALEIDPFSINFSNSLANHYYYGRLFDQAIEQYQKTIKINPKFAQAHADLARVYEQQKRYDQAIAELNQAIALSKRTPRLVASLGYVFAKAGRTDEAQKLLEELKQTAKRESVPSADFALIYLGLDDRDEAMNWLRKCYADRSILLLNIKVDPIFERIRSDRRFAALQKQVG
ncbi:MAG TPA: protein kinase [Blastocatellia bacterium]|nr:protein kinase [Blastocatellia bacterium]